MRGNARLATLRAAALDTACCAGCNREFQVGDRYIEDTSSGFLKADAEPEIDALVAGIFGGSDGKVRFCEDCTVDGGDYLFETFYADEDKP